MFASYKEPAGALNGSGPFFVTLSSHNLGFIIGCKSSCPSGALLLKATPPASASLQTNLLPIFIQ